MSSQWATLASLFTVVIEMDAAGDIVRASPLVEDRLSRQDVTKQNFFDVFTFKRPAHFKGGVQGALAVGARLFLGYSDTLQLAIRGQIITSETELDGCIFAGVPWLGWARERYGEDSLSAAAFPAHDSQMDQVLFMSTQQRMVDDLQELNSELTRAKERVEILGDSRQDFFNRISHEVRTPLTGIASALTLLADLRLGEEASELISLAETSVERAVEVTSFALDSAASGFNDISGLATSVDLQHLISRTQHMFIPTARAKGIELISKLDPALSVNYWCNQQLIREILINLLSNAVKFTDAGTVSLTLSVRPSDDPSVDVITFSVADSGPGIPKDIREQIFEPFETGLTVATRDKKGTGLGLSTTLKHVRALGSEMTVDTSEYGGALFSFSISARSDATKILKVDESSSEEAPLRFNQHCLLLDDSATNLALNAQLLRTMGFAVTEVKTGEEAISTCRSSDQEFDLALLDINLPDMSGYQVASALRQLPQCQYTTLIALSAYSEDEEIQRAKDVGMAGFIKKPFRRDDIGRVFAALLASDEQQIGEEVDSNDMIETDGDVAEGFDHGVFSNMVDTLGIESVSMIAEGLASEGRDNLKELSSGVKTNDTESAERAAHTLASSCQSLGMMASGNYTRELELGLRSRDEIDQSMLTKASDLFEADLTQLQSAVKALS